MVFLKKKVNGCCQNSCRLLYSVYKNICNLYGLFKTLNVRCILSIREAHCRGHYIQYTSTYAEMKRKKEYLELTAFKPHNLIKISVDIAHSCPKRPANVLNAQAVFGSSDLKLNQKCDPHSTFTWKFPMVSFNCSFQLILICFCIENVITRYTCLILYICKFVSSIWNHVERKWLPDLQNSNCKKLCDWYFLSGEHKNENWWW